MIMEPSLANCTLCPSLTERLAAFSFFSAAARASGERASNISFAAGACLSKLSTARVGGSAAGTGAASSCGVPANSKLAVITVNAAVNAAVTAGIARMVVFGSLHPFTEQSCYAWRAGVPVVALGSCVVGFGCKL